ncbi:protein of unknown function DUF303 [Macleaya cordata]|uniref:Sialate O-acetylesterase domain-containing protein n=1 Tax=Macleaya cordata TaxID=56857 RepID=A0A200PV36_MACCD|nr:protein of unknown function DUF303 [Macleaya cordata]
MLYFWSLLLLAYAGLVKPAQFLHRSDGFQDKNIFVLAGQSNMAGRGGVIVDKWDGIIPPECQPNSSILRLNSGLEWEEAREPLHFDIDLNKTVGVGPGMAFANAIRDNKMNSSIGVVGLVPCAIGGTKISEWAQGTHLYNEFVRRSKASLKEGGTIRAILWYQGESDTVIREDADRYGENLKKLIGNMRDDLQLPMLPFIQVALASGQGPFVEVVRKAQLELDLPNVWCVDADGLPLESDSLHLTTQAQVRLGQMLAESFFMKTVQQQSRPISNDAPKRTHYLL